MSPFQLHHPPNLAHVRTWPGGMPGHWGECGARGRSCKPLPGGFRHHASRHYDRGGRCIPGLGQAGAGNARCTAQDLRSPVGAGFPDRALLPRPRKPGLKLSLWDDKSLWREPWWNADRRAHPAGCAAVPAARQVPDCVCRRSASFLLGFLAFVIAGLDPAIHAATGF